MNVPPCGILGPIAHDFTTLVEKSTLRLRVCDRCGVLEVTNWASPHYSHYFVPWTPPEGA